MDAAQLDALPVGSVVLDGSGMAYQRLDERWWFEPGREPGIKTDNLAKFAGTWTVVHVPNRAALPPGSVILDRDGAAWQLGSVGEWWSNPFDDSERTTDELEKYAGPLTVLYVAPNDAVS